MIVTGIVIDAVGNRFRPPSSEHQHLPQVPPAWWRGGPGLSFVMSGIGAYWMMEKVKEMRGTSSKAVSRMSVGVLVKVASLSAEGYLRYVGLRLVERQMEDGWERELCVDHLLLLLHSLPSQTSDIS